MKEKRGRPRKELTEREKIWLVEFLDRSDISYTNPGREDSVYIGKINGESQYMQKKYLVWPLREIVSIANSQEAVDESFESKFDKILTFSQLCDFLKGHKEYVYNINIPHASCLCEICENSSLLAKGLNKLKRKLKTRLPTNPYDLVETFSCDSDEVVCMLEKCSSCQSSKIIDQLISGDEDVDEDSSEPDSPVCDSEPEGGNIVFYRWQTVDKKITMSKIEVSFKDAIEMLKDELVVLKEYIHIEGRQVNAYQDMKASLGPNDLMVQVNFAESYKNDQQGAIQSVYFGDQCFGIFSNLYVWSDGMGAQFRSRFVLQILACAVFQEKYLVWCYNERHHGKGPMDGVGGTVKNVIFRKVKSGKVVIYSPQEFAEAVKKFVPAIHAVYLPESENIVKPVGIESARKIKDTLKIHKFERKVDPNGNKYINFYKIADDEEPFHVQWYGGENDVICGHVNSSDNDNVQNVVQFIKKVKSGYAVQCVTIGFTKNISMSEDYFMYFRTFT